MNGIRHTVTIAATTTLILLGMVWALAWAATTQAAANQVEWTKREAYRTEQVAYCTELGSDAAACLAVLGLDP